MKVIFENVIRSGNYKLVDMQHKIKKSYVENDITEAEMNELLDMAARGANLNGERPGEDVRFAFLLERIEKLEAEVFKEEIDGDMGEGTETEPEVEAWKPWDGISNKYQPGAIVAHNDKIWESIFPGQNVWEPGTQGTENMWIAKDIEE